MYVLFHGTSIKHLKVSMSRSIVTLREDRICSQIRIAKYESNHQEAGLGAGLIRSFPQYAGITVLETVRVAVHYDNN